LNQQGLQHLEDIRKSFPYAPNLPQRLDVRYKLPMDGHVVAAGVEFLRRVNDSLNPIGLDGAVVGISGGIDSVATALLAQQALGPERVWKVVVDYGVFRGEMPAIAEAKQIAQLLGGPVISVPIGDLVVRRGRAGDLGTSWFLDLNLQTRSIQNVLFEVADRKSAWVVSTTDRSERLLGRFTEFFYGHGEPLSDLYKTEVYDLARQLGAPEMVLSRKAGCESWMWDDDLFGTTYDVIDPVLYLLTEQHLTPDEVSRKCKIDAEWVRKLAQRMHLQQPRLSTNRLLGLRPTPRDTVALGTTEGFTG